MKLKDKLQMLMTRQGLNGQKLSRLASVSDSEISRILQGKSRPGLDNAFRLARAVNVTLDYLADDSVEIDAGQPADHLSPEERKLLGLAQKLGAAEAVAILENVRFLGYETAMARLVGARAPMDPERNPAEPRVSAPPSSGAAPSSIATAPIAAAAAPRAGATTV